MSFTKVYRFQNLPGYESVISKGNSEMTYMGIPFDSQYCYFSVGKYDFDIQS